MTDDHPAPPEEPAAKTRILDELGTPITAARIAEIAQHVRFKSDTVSWNIGLVLNGLCRAVERGTAELSAIREAVSADADETTLAAVEWMATEWRHYSKEMHRAGYETIPKLEQELQASREREAGFKKSAMQIVGFMEDASELWGNPAADSAMARLRRLAAPEHADPEVTSNDRELPRV